MKKMSITFFAGALMATSCTNNNLKQQDVWVPIYKNKAEVNAIVSLPSQTISASGKIYAYRDYVFQLEQNHGIHVYKLEQKVPKPYRFIQVYGAQEISIKDGYLYTNNFNDVVTINISNLTDVKVVSRLPNAFTLNTFDLPPTKGYFQCVDSTKGMVIGWEKQHNIDANCIY